jgi:hypothetical protein
MNKVVEGTNKFQALKVSADGSVKKVQMPKDGIFRERPDKSGVQSINIPRPWITHQVLEIALDTLELTKDEQDLVQMMIVNCQSRDDNSYHTYRSTDESVAPMYQIIKTTASAINKKYRELKDKTPFKSAVMTQEEYDAWVTNAQAKRGTFL